MLVTCFDSGVARWTHAINFTKYDRFQEHVLPILAPWARVSPPFPLLVSPVIVPPVTTATDVTSTTGVWTTLVKTAPHVEILLLTGMYVTACLAMLATNVLHYKHVFCNRVSMAAGAWACQRESSPASVLTVFLDVFANFGIPVFANPASMALSVVALTTGTSAVTAA